MLHVLLHDPNIAQVPHAPPATSTGLSIRVRGPIPSSQNGLRVGDVRGELIQKDSKGSQKLRHWQESHLRSAWKPSKIQESDR